MKVRVQTWGNNAGKYDTLCQAVESRIKFKLIFGKRLLHSGPERKAKSGGASCPRWTSFLRLLLGRGVSGRVFFFNLSQGITVPSLLLSTCPAQLDMGTGRYFEGRDCLSFP